MKASTKSMIRATSIINEPTINKSGIYVVGPILFSISLYAYDDLNDIYKIILLNLIFV